MFLVIYTLVSPIWTRFMTPHCWSPDLLLTFFNPHTALVAAPLLAATWPWMKTLILPRLSISLLSQRILLLPGLRLFFTLPSWISHSLTGRCWRYHRPEGTWICSYRRMRSIHYNAPKSTIPMDMLLVTATLLGNTYLFLQQ